MHPGPRHVLWASSQHGVWIPRVGGPKGRARQKIDRLSDLASGAMPCRCHYHRSYLSRESENLPGFEERELKSSHVLESNFGHVCLLTATPCLHMYNTRVQHVVGPQGTLDMCAVDECSGPWVGFSSGSLSGLRFDLILVCLDLSFLSWKTNTELLSQ